MVAHIEILVFIIEVIVFLVKLFVSFAELLVVLLDYCYPYKKMASRMNILAIIIKISENALPGTCNQHMY